jgi:hypothetical protein
MSRPRQNRRTIDTDLRIPWGRIVGCGSSHHLAPGWQCAPTSGPDLPHRTSMIWPEAPPQPRRLSSTQTDAPQFPPVSLVVRGVNRRARRGGWRGPCPSHPLSNAPNRRHHRHNFPMTMDRMGSVSVEARSIPRCLQPSRHMSDCRSVVPMIPLTAGGKGHLRPGGAGT